MIRVRRFSPKRLLIGLLSCWLCSFYVVWAQSAPSRSDVSTSSPSNSPAGTSSPSAPPRSTPKPTDYFTPLPQVEPLQISDTLQLIVPENKAVTPGEFVTLVFRLESSAPASVEAVATSALGWDILRQPGTLELAPNESKPVALTITVPSDAAATSVETITLNIGKTAPVTLNLIVKELRDLDVQAPVDVVLGKDVLRVLLTNKGNVTDEVKLELLATGEIVETRDLTLEPRSEREEVFELEREGLYIVKLTNTTGIDISRAVNVIRYGVPEPEPFNLVGAAHAGVDTNLSWGTALTLGGSLSSDWVVDGLLEAPRWRRSFASLDSGDWGFRVGYVPTPRPFFTNFPQLFGVAGRHSQDEASLLGSFGWSGGNTWTGYLAPTLETDGARIAVGAGISGGQGIASASYAFAYPGGESSLVLSYLPGGFNAEGGFEVINLPGKFTVKSGFRHVGEADVNFGVQADYSFDTFFMYGGGTVALGPDAISDYSAGVSSNIPANLPGQLNFGVQFTSLSRGAALRHSIPFGNGWHTSNQVGMFFDKDGFGVSLDTRFSVAQQNYLSVDGSFILRDNLPFDGKLGARLEIPFDTVNTYGEAEWTLGAQNVGVSAGARWQADTFALETYGGVNYNYSGEVAPVTGQIAVKGTYSFTLQVSEGVTETFGGRNVGRLSGVVRAGDLPVPDIHLEIDRYTLVTDENGAFSADLLPGEYEVKLDAATLPITIRLMAEDKATITLERGKETTLVFEAAATAAIAGRVLEDANADGVADEPNKLVPAQLILTDSEGLRRSIFSNSEEGFLVRGLLPGSARLKVLNLPLGSTLVGSDVLEFPLTAGEISEVTFLAVPPTTVSQTFTSTDLRIRRIKTEVDRVPVNTAPLVTVTIQGEAERVTLQSDAGTYDMVFDGEAWQTRLPIPASTTDLYAFTVVAYKGDGQTTKKSQLIIDPTSPAIELTTASPVRPNEVITVETLGYFAVKDIQIQSELGLTFETVQNEEGHFISTATIPATAQDKVYKLNITVVSEDGQTFVQEETFRVLIQ
jgi:hypothetical protein